MNEKRMRKETQFSSKKLEKEKDEPNYDKNIRDFGRKLVVTHGKIEKINIEVKMIDGRTYEYNSHYDYGSQPLIEKRKKKLKKESEEYAELG